MYKFLKRLTDILLSGIALLILFPLLIIIMILLKFTGEGEIFYRQERVGHKNKTFKILKFATMLKDSPNIGTGDVTLRNDPRVTPLGKYLRITKINELPQLFNILFGDMSIIGPRPLMKSGFSRYEQKYQDHIYNVKPGLSGIGSVVFRDEEKIVTESDLDPHECYGKIILPYKGALEIWYQEHASLLTDFKIIFLTVWVIIFPKSKLAYKMFNDLPERDFSLS